jgi:16S rRNA A1518/A1519 N6-dimethyltransferase RsmA/KsgA/DIM1 with predicted DNA glycosylase/AP lyase activity
MNYDKFRWDYPAELFADAIRYAGQGNGKRVIEIGAGTGKATTPFLDAGYAITAVRFYENIGFTTQKRVMELEVGII